MKQLRKWWKSLGKRCAASLYVVVPRQMNDKTVRVPVIEGRKLGARGERWMSGLLKILLARCAGTFVDVGVNLGQTLAKVKTLEPERVYAGFEPSPFCQHYVGRLIDENGWTEVTLCPCALFDRDQLLQMNGASEGAASATLLPELRPGRNAAATWVPAYRFEVVRSALPKGRVAIIKIDVEGAEVEVIRELRPLIEEDRPILTLEVLPIQGEANEFRTDRNLQLRQLMAELKYSMHRIEKTDADAFAGVELDPEFGTGADAKSKDYVAVPEERVDEIKGWF